MNTSLFRRSFKDRRRSMAWWALGIALLGAMYTALYPALEDLFTELDDYPEEILKAFGLEGAADLATPAGYLQVELMSFMAPIAFIVFAAIMGVGAIAGSERKGEMELLLANPISRSTVFAQRFWAMLASVVILAAILWATIAIGIPLGVWSELGLWNLVQAMLSLVLLGCAFGAIALCASGVTGNSGVSYSLVGALALGTFVINSFSQIIDGMDPAKWATPFHYYMGSDPLTSGLNWWHALVPAGITVLMYFVGNVAFSRRDLKQPGA